MSIIVTIYHLHDHIIRKYLKSKSSGRSKVASWYPYTSVKTIWTGGLIACASCACYDHSSWWLHSAAQSPPGRSSPYKQVGLEQHWEVNRSFVVAPEDVFCTVFPWLFPKSVHVNLNSFFTNIHRILNIPKLSWAGTESIWRGCPQDKHHFFGCFWMGGMEIPHRIWRITPPAQRLDHKGSQNIWIQSPQPEIGGTMVPSRLRLNLLSIFFGGGHSYVLVVEGVSLAANMSRFTQILWFSLKY